MTRLDDIRQHLENRPVTAPFFADDDITYLLKRLEAAERLAEATMAWDNADHAERVHRESHSPCADERGRPCSEALALAKTAITTRNNLCAALSTWEQSDE